MKILITSLALVLMFSSPSGARPTASAPNENAKADSASHARLEYQKKVDAKLRELDEQIEVLKQKAVEQSKEGRRQLDKQITELDQKREVARQKLEKFKASSQGAWRDMKPGIDAAMKDLETAYRRAASHFQ